MSDTTPTSNIVNRVRKLLALATEGSGATEAEAASAAAKAAALLAEYNLSLAELDAATEDESAVREKRDLGIQARHDWQRNLMRAVAEGNFCAYWIEHRMTDRDEHGEGRPRKRAWFMLVGRRANVVSTVEMYRYLRAAAMRLLPYADRRDRSARSWFDGFADRLVSRLSDARREREVASYREREARRTAAGGAPNGSGRELVLADVYSTEEELNNDMRWGYHPGTTANRRRAWKAQQVEAAARAAATVAKVDANQKQETEAQRRQREKREERHEERWRAQWQRHQEREAARVDHSAYAAGLAAGAEVGLAPQVAVTQKTLLK